MADDVIVIGAGLAGLNAALALEAAGARVRVLEAQQRVGGRIHSMGQHGSTTEAGGTFIGAGYVRVIAAAERYGVQLVDVTPLLQFFREQDLVLGGETIRQRDWPTHPRNPFPARDKEQLPWNYHRVLTVRDNPLAAPEDWLDPEHAALDVSAYEWLRGLGLSDEAIAVAYGINPSYGRDARDVSALLLLFRGAFSRAQRAHASKDSIGFTAQRGVQRIPEAMRDALRGELQLGCEVTVIAATAAGLEVRCANGSHFAARHVVVAIPPGVLRRIAIDPPLPAAQAAAVTSLPSQPLTQVYLRPKSRFWEGDGYAPSLFTDSHAGMIAAARDRLNPGAVTSFAAWIAGDAAAELDRLPPAEAGAAVIREIERLRPAAKGQLELIGSHSWGADPYAAGAWVYFRPGEVTRFAGIIGRPHGRLHFCGEHLAVANRGMEGAMESGERAAAEILTGAA
jgi:monoamine oxidase